MSDETDFRPPAAETVEPSVDPYSDRATPGSVYFLDPLDALPPAGTLGTREEIQKELDLIAAHIRIFHRMQPDQVMRACSGYTARLTELEVLLHRVESSDRQYTRVRTQQVERFITELERQWKTASRLVEVMRQDLDLSR
jgi:hypothetical protein